MENMRGWRAGRTAWVENALATDENMMIRREREINFIDGNNEDRRRGVMGDLDTLGVYVA
jgi:hypothetical protein